MSANTNTVLDFTRADFPEGFEFGVATSAYQIEGASFGGAGLSHWDTFAATPGNVAGAENGSVACDHYHRWAEDFDLIRDCRLDSYRFSTSWARVIPDGVGAVNQEGLDFYDRLVDGLLARGIKPYACLYHWELPAALADLGGWRNPSIADWFADFTEVVMGRIGDRLQAAATFNEPWCIAWLSHFLGQHAPGLRDIRAAARAMHHVLLAHGRAVQVMRGLKLNSVGVVMNLEYSAPVDETEAAIAAARRNEAIYNRWFLEAVFKKSYPEEALAGLEPHLPTGWADDFDIIAEPVDWLGINYYTRKRIAADPEAAWPSLKEVEGPLPKTAMDWEIYPDGLYHFLSWAAKTYSGELPIYVTENGMASYDRVDLTADAAERVADPDRIAYLNGHLAAVKRAIDDGAPVKGYFIWSLLDNFEWALGYDKRFGLVHVDFESLARTPKQSWHALKAALSSND
ncbi:MAG: GH1 family beta-glucosidase [Alphaproteobacteria bacterium]|nr:GH1 family beta-glucosidase [Alphaproteobacteria bacterium]